MKDEKKKDFALKISHANKSELVVILYEIFLTYLEDASIAMQNKNTISLRKNISSAKNCLRELTNSLNFSVEPATTLHQLYLYVSKKLTEVIVYLNIEPMIEVQKIMHKLYLTSIKAAELDQTAAILQNAQTLTAGLTYTKNQLSINLQDGSNSRGFFV